MLLSISSFVIVVVQSPSHVWLLETPMDCCTPGFLVPHYVLKFAQVHFHCIGDAIQPSHPLTPSSPSVLNLSQHQGLFQWVSHSKRWPKYWSFSFSFSLSNEYSGLISFKIDWFDLLAVQGTFRNFLQHHSLKASIVWRSAFLMVQLSQPYMTTGKTIALTICTFVGRVMSLLFNTLSRFVIAFLPRSNRLLISWLQSPSTVILEPKKRKSVTISTFYPSICHEVMELDALILDFLIFSLKLTFSLSFFTLIKRFFCSSSLSAIRVVSSAYLRLLMFLPPVLILACNSSSPAFLMISSAYRLNKQGDSSQSCCTPFWILNQSVVPYRVLTLPSWPAYRLIRRQGIWSGIPISLRAFHGLSWSTQSKTLA